MPSTILTTVVLLDQITKWWAIISLTDQPSVKVFGDFLMFTLVFNEGGAMGTSFGPSIYYLVSSALILLVVIYYLYQNRYQRQLAIPLSLIAAGAIGNLIDRIRLGMVIDFIDIDIFDIDLFGYHLERWWTFNLADSAISCSIVFLLIYLLFCNRPSDKNRESDDLSQAHPS